MTHHKMSNKTIDLINQTHLTITKQSIVFPTQFIIITISGGQDSLCLFFILLHLKKQWKWHFGLLYCNHFWQIDSFYINSLIFKLGFFFLIPAYLSLPSENIFSEQKSRTWRYRQFDRLTTFYKYDIIFTGHTSTDKIETVLLQLVRGTGTRGLSTLDWIRPSSKYKSITSSLPLKIVPKVSSSLSVLTKTNKPAFIFKTNNVSFYHKFFRVQFCNQSFLSSQINCLKNYFFDKTKKQKTCILRYDNKLILYDKVQEFLVEIFSQNKNRVLLEKQNVLNNKHAENRSAEHKFYALCSALRSWSQKVFPNSNLPLSPLSASLLTLVLDTNNLKIKEQVSKSSSNSIKNLSIKLFFIAKPKSLKLLPFFCRYRPDNETKVKPRVLKVTRFAFQSSFVDLFFQIQSSWEKIFYGKNLDYNIITLQENWKKISYHNTNWIYDDFLFLTLEKTLIFTPFDKLRYFYLKQNGLFPALSSAAYAICGNYKNRNEEYKCSALFRLHSLNSLNLIKVINQRKKNINYFNFQSYYSYDKNLICLSLIQQEKLFQLQFNLPSPLLSILLINLLQKKSTTFNTRFARPAPFSISRRIIFKDYFETRLVSAVANKIQSSFSLTSSNRLKFSAKWKFKHARAEDKCSPYLTLTGVGAEKNAENWCSTLRSSAFSVLNSWKNKDSSFAFNTVILNQKSSNVLIKYLKISCWAQFKKPFLELPVFQLENVLNLEITPFLIKSYLCLTNYQQIVILLIICPSITFPFFLDIFCAPSPIFDNLAVSQQVNSLNKKYIEQLNLDLNVLSYQKQKQIKDLVLFTNSNHKLKSIFSQASQYNLKKQKQGHNWGKSYFVCQASIKNNNLKQVKKNVKLNKLLNSVTRTKPKTIINCYHLYLENKTKNFLHKKWLRVNTSTYKINDHTIFLSLQNKSNFSSQIGKDIRLVLPNKKGFGWYDKNIKQSFVVRPLLFITRFDLKKLCAFWELPVYPDQTNEKLVYFRNRIRKQLLPLLRFFFNPQIDKLFLQFAEIATTEQLYLDELIVHLQDKFEIKKINTFELNLAVFHFIPIAIKRRLLKQFLNQYFTKQIKFFHIKILLDALAKRKKNHSFLPLGKSELYKKKCKNNLLIRENLKVEYQVFPKLIFQESLNTMPITEEQFLDKLEVLSLTTKIRSEFLQYFIFAKQGPHTKAKVKHNLANLDKKLSLRNIFFEKNQLKTPQILFFSGVGACFMTSRRFILLSNFIIV